MVEQAEIPLFKNILAEATLAPSQLVSDDVKSFDLGGFRVEAEKMLTLDRQFPPFEFINMGMIFVDNQGRVLMHKDVNMVQTGLPVAIDISGYIQEDKSAKGLPRLFRQQRYFAGMLQTNSSGIIFPAQLATLIRSIEDPAAATTFMSNTPDGIDVYFRGQQTPNLEGEEVMKKVFLWMKSADLQIKEFSDKKDSLAERIASVERIYRGLTRQIIKSYGLQHFRANGNDPVAYRQIESI